MLCLPSSRRLTGCLLLLITIAVACVAQNAPPGGGPIESAVQHERYEWSNIWWDCANDRSLPRVLLIGDSISCGYSAGVTRLLEGRYHVDRLGTSRSINDPVLAKETVMMLQEYPYVAVHFNNGLHGFHLDAAQYAAALATWVGLIREHGTGAALIWASSTPITENGAPEKLSGGNQTVLARNEAAAAVMQTQGIATNDLYSVVIDRPQLRSADGYHYNGDGYDLLAQAVAEAVLGLVSEP
jgi:hypothetical protein